MTGLDDVILEKVMVHKVGNPSRAEELRLSQQPLTLNDEIVNGLLVKYFLGSFNEHELFRFTHLSNLQMNEVYQYCVEIFEEPSKIIENSQLLAKFLYEKSTHSKIKEGELYVVLFDNVMFENEPIKAIGLFKSENKQSFLKVFPHGANYEVIHEEGININKLDKGCLIFHSALHEGAKVCVVDHTNKGNDTQYWIDEFLQVEPYADSYHQTDKYLNLCKTFITNEYPDKFEVSKKEQIDLLSKSIEYFTSHEQFNLQEFAEEVMHYPEVVDTFMDFKKNFEANRNFEIEDEFSIHVNAVKKQQKVFKSVLKLDKNFHIYIHGRRDLIEKGVDEMTGKKFYKIYFDEES